MTGKSLQKGMSMVTRDCACQSILTFSIIFTGVQGASLALWLVPGDAMRALPWRHCAREQRGRLRARSCERLLRGCLLAGAHFTLVNRNAVETEAFRPLCLVDLCVDFNTIQKGLLETECPPVFITEILLTKLSQKCFGFCL